MTDLQELIYNVIKAHGSIDRAALDEWVETNAPGTTRMLIGQNLRSLRDGGKINQDGDTWSIATKPVVNHNADNDKVEIPSFFQKAKPVTVSISYGEEEIEDVIDASYMFNGAWVPLMLWGNMRVMISENLPRWSPQQRSVSGATKLKLVLRDKRVIEKNIGRNQNITFAPAED